MDNLLEIGKIVNTHGLRGEVKIVPWTDTPDVFEDIETVYIKKKNEYNELTIKGIKYQKNNIIVKFEQLSDISEAELLKNTVVYTTRDQLPELEEGVYYITDLIGCSVIDDNNEKIGDICDVISTGSNDVYVVKRPEKKDLLIPVIEDAVLNVDIENKVVTVHILEGLEDL